MYVELNLEKCSKLAGYDRNDVTTICIMVIIFVPVVVNLKVPKNSRICIWKHANLVD